MDKEYDKDQIDELISRIDNFMACGGGRMNVTGGEGTADEYHCTSCCGESADPEIKTPAK